jgi:FkbM family methyltransferase
MNFQTIFYDRASGSIVKVIPVRYVKNKADKEACCRPHDPRNIAFIYVKGLDEINPATDIVVPSRPGAPPQLYTQGGLPFAYRSLQSSFASRFAGHSALDITFWGQLGDGLEQIPAVLAWLSAHPGASVRCLVSPCWIPLFSMLYPNLTFLSRDDAKTSPRGSLRLTMEPSWLDGPWVQQFGAASCYSIQLGLDPIPYSPAPPLVPSFSDDVSDTLAKFNLPVNDKIIAICPVSNSSGGRSWDGSKIPALIACLSKIPDACFVLLGQTTDLSDHGPMLTDLSGLTSVTEFAHIVSRSWHVITVDTAALHLALAFDIPSTCIWGNSTPGAVLGRPVGPADVMPLDDGYHHGTASITAQAVADNLLLQRVADLPFGVGLVADYSQMGEQAIIARFFEERPAKHRFFVDCGAYGVDMSNTLALAKCGWAGLMIEPNPAAMGPLTDALAGLSVVIAPFGASDADEVLPLRIHSVAGHNSFIKGWYPQTETPEQIEISCMPLAKLLKLYNVPPDFDLLSIDTEGMDKRIMLEFFRQKKFRPTMIITEATSYQNPVDFFAAHGYTLLAKTGDERYGNCIFALGAHDVG